MAKQVAPDDPFVSSTLGWILYKRGVYQRALALLREGAVRLPDNPELQYHLGMAAARTGDKDLARKALAVAAGSPATFKGQDEARKALAELRRGGVRKERRRVPPGPAHPVRDPWEAFGGRLG